MAERQNSGARETMRGVSVWAVAPLLLFAALGAVFAFQLFSKNDTLPSALINRPAPDFDLPTLDAALAGEPDRARLRRADLAQGRVSVVNFFASWCAPCRVEHPELRRLAEMGVAPVYGVAYRDRPQDARAFLDQLGDPFAVVGVDETNAFGLQWGLAGVPETFILTGDGRVAFKHVGPIQNDDLETKILPAIRAAAAL